VHLFGRQTERETIDRVIAEANTGRSSALLAQGEPGIGKTALLDYAATAAESLGFQVQRAVGMESERQFAYAGLHQLCAPLLAFESALAEPQRGALDVAFGRKTGAAPELFLVGLAVLSLLALSADERPLLCLVDDAQWLDPPSAQVVAFVARRVSAERVALLIAAREATEGDPIAFAGIPALTLTRLDDSDARALLAAEVHAPIDDAVRERVIAEAYGNPLALLELPRNWQPETLASGHHEPGRPSMANRLEKSFRHRSAELPAQTQQLLLVAAAEPTGDPALLFRAASHLGIERDAASPAEAVGLLTIDTVVRFRHPLVRSALYGAAAPSERRRTHDVLAAATDARVDPDRRAWHRGQAALGVDENVASELEHASDQALKRGGMAAAAAFMQRAAELTPDSDTRIRRAMAAAAAKHESGAPHEALQLLTVVARGPMNPLQSARLKLFRAQIAFYLSHDDNAPGQFVEAARALAPLDRSMSRETFLLALDASIIIGGGATGSVRNVAEAARSAPAPPEPPRPMDYLLDGVVTTYTAGFAAGAAELRSALESFRENQLDSDAVRESDSDRWLWLASRIAVALFDDELMRGLASRNVALARRAEAVATLRAALTAHSAMLVLTGEFTRATQLAVESTAISRATDGVPLPYGELFLAAWRGNTQEITEVYRERAVAAGSDTGAETMLVHYALAVVHNASGEFASALKAAARASESDEPSFVTLALPEMVEAAARAGQHEQARAAFERLDLRARASGTQWALGVTACARALITPGNSAEEHYREAIERLADSRMIGLLGRAHLVYGEWLRREGRREHARKQLRTAHRLLTDMGALGFAERATRELRATGEHPRQRTPRPTEVLTEHELHIARVVATGATSREVAAMLFLSPRTIEAHLRSIFRKLGITSRRQLKQLFPQ
jgi:DNA-binding CsgD family transcriptional regulator